MFPVESNEAPRYEFTWPWGQVDQCGEDGKPLVLQRLQALGADPVGFIPLDPNRKQPITRDERTQLIAAKLSAEEECNQVKAEAAKLESQKLQLQTEARRAVAHARDLTAQLADKNAALTTVIAERDDALAKLHDARDEAERLRLLVPRE